VCGKAITCKSKDFLYWCLVTYYEKHALSQTHPAIMIKEVNNQINVVIKNIVKGIVIHFHFTISGRTNNMSYNY
jgi:hypothetical protein